MRPLLRGLVVALAVGLFVVQGASLTLASHQVPTCGANAVNYFSIFCHAKGAAGITGVYQQWPSTSLNLTQAKANSGYWIAEATWLFADPGSWLETGDTAGTGTMNYNANAWERHWYWVDGTSGLAGYQVWDIQLAPSDGATRAWGMQWDTDHWGIYIGGALKVWVNQWRNPSTFANPIHSAGMEIYNGQSGGHALALDSGMNSGLFRVNQIQYRNAINAWSYVPAITLQVDSPCGSAPTCLQGYVSGDSFYNAKP